MAKKITKIGITPAGPNMTTGVSSATRIATTPMRGSAIPKPTTPTTPRGQITHEMIAKRAYEIWKSGKGGSEFDNWVRAERELRGM